MDLLDYMVDAHEAGERGLYLTVRLVLDQGVEAGAVARRVGVSESTLYRKLREYGLTYGRGYVPPATVRTHRG